MRIETPYYRLYRRDPAKARRLVYGLFKRCGENIRLTARTMGCSRNTVRRILKRALAERPRWENKPCGFPSHKKNGPPRKRGVVVGTWPLSLLPSSLSDIRKSAHVGALLVKQSD